MNTTFIFDVLHKGGYKFRILDSSTFYSRHGNKRNRLLEKTFLEEMHVLIIYSYTVTVPDDNSQLAIQTTQKPA